MNDEQYKRIAKLIQLVRDEVRMRDDDDDDDEDEDQERGEA